MKICKPIIFVLSVFLLLQSCETSLTEYTPKNDSEKQIKELLTTYVDARNKGDIATLAALFHDNGKYLAGNGATWTKIQIAESKPEWWVQYGTVKLLNSEFTITDTEATVTSTGKWGYTFKTPHIAALIKEDGKWLIVKVKTGN